MWAFGDGIKYLRLIRLGMKGGETMNEKFDLEQYEAELDSLIAEVIPGKEDPLA